ncbi:MAG: hypothetical protein N3E40_06330 [Dehalococcoidia bacterium]|nr:hypothetical protein [Dehalococcoidia bacterium]
METLVTREASVSPQATETTTERPSEGPAPEATGPSRPVPPSGSAEQPSETSPAGAGAVPETMLPPKNLLTAPEHVHAPAIAPAPIKAELVAPPELLPLPASAAAGKGAGRAISEEATGPEPAVPTTPPAPPPETPPTKEGLTAAPRVTGQTGQPEKAGWGIPLARPPLGPLA